MPTQKREQRRPQSKPQEKVEDQKVSSGSAEDQVTEDLLDEIDEVLETNAAEFVETYRQRGGQ